jgi:hypothetical protein
VTWRLDHEHPRKRQSLIAGINCRCWWLSGEQVTEIQCSRYCFSSRTPAVAGNRRTWTWAGWVKRGRTGGSGDVLFSAYSGIDDRDLYVTFVNVSVSSGPTDGIALFSPPAGNNIAVVSNAVYRDHSAWYHIVVACDTTQATPANRTKLYVNGSEVTYNVTTYPSQDQDLNINNTQPHALGSRPNGLSLFSGYLAEVFFIDGQALTPSSFTEVSATTGQLIPLAYTGTYGTNGFQLKFADNSAATAATLGADTSGNGNNWTPNNLSVTAGAGNDSLVDTPTSYGTDTGVGGEVRGNYATLNPLNKASAVTLSNGNLDVVGTSWNWAMTTIAVNSGKWYWEVTHTNGGADNLFCGIAKTTFQNFTYDLNHAGSDSYNLWGYTSYFGNKEGQGSSTSYGATFQTAGDIVGCALDMDAGTITFYKNGVSQGQAFSGITAQVCPVWGGTGSSIGAANFNFGQRAFAYPVSGFKALCDTNLGAQ